MPDQHVLMVTTRETSVLCDGRCSCGKLVMRNRSHADLQSMHGEHLQEAIGPDARKEAARG